MLTYLAEVLCEFFLDKKQGGFYFTASDHEPLPQRPKPLHDEAIPSGNSIAAISLLRLGYLIGEQKYLDIAEQTLKMSWKTINEHPSTYNSMLFVLEEYLDPITIIILRGQQEMLEEWQQYFYSCYLPKHICFAISDLVTDLPIALQKPSPQDGVSAYVCQGRECHKTINSLNEFKTYLQEL